MKSCIILIYVKNNLTRRQLQERIKNKEYDRLSSETKNKLITKEKLKVNDLVPNPIIIKNKFIKRKLNRVFVKTLNIK